MTNFAFENEMVPAKEGERVSGNAEVFGVAKVYGKADVTEMAKILKYWEMITSIKQK
jgi:hypothetical protein